MGMPIQNHSDSQLFSASSAGLASLPGSIEATGLSENLLMQLMIKLLHFRQVATLSELSEGLALSGLVCQTLLEKAKRLQWLENLQAGQHGQMRYTLSGLGRLEAERALQASGYIGAAPVPLNQYSDICLRQTHRQYQITQSQMHQCLQGMIFADDALDTLGAALNSSKPTLLYGPPGVGKSYLCRHIIKVLDDHVLVPHALEVNGQVIQILDPQVHEAVDTAPTGSLMQSSHDPRWVKCRRPLIVTGGELTESMLEVGFDSTSRLYKAPLQLKANNGILLLDDLGRQKISPAQLFNRWIIPLEERRDFLALQNGIHFCIPFELVLLFSTNLSPSALMDNAFLRRLGYKIELQPMSADAYRQVWQDNCQKLNLQCEAEVFEHLLEQLHASSNKPLFPCYPRDLLSLIRDAQVYQGLPNLVSKQQLNQAWQHYFVE
ncbi:ATP-binding protein [Bowmanella pacifica]|uniref:ATPase AAA n=1 Tax=Bowmanella pacifica TaxID=502051 RepID=A0A918DHX1_9ALTE|nr:AAA family ATPase [Bowmanella pacifica]GGO65078.1 ATPase AAA [Bowmanella pacifica]